MENQQSPTTGGTPYQGNLSEPSSFYPSEQSTLGQNDQTTSHHKLSASEAKEKARQGLNQFREKTSQKTHEAINRARGYGESVVTDQQHRVAQGIHGYSSAIRSTAEKLREQKDENIACYVDAAAEQVERMASYVENRALRDMANDASAIASKQPAVVVGGAFFAGLALARFLKAGASRNRYSTSDQLGYGNDYDYDYLDREPNLDYGMPEQQASGPIMGGPSMYQPGPFVSSEPFQETNEQKQNPYGSV